MKRLFLLIGISAFFAVTSSIFPGVIRWGEAASWQLLPAPSPGVHVPSYAYDTSRRKGVLFGGYGESCLGSCAQGYSQDTWEWDGTAWTKINISGPIPSARASQPAAFGAAWGKLVLQGGFNNDFYSSDTWTYDGTNWSLASTNGPQRADQAAAYDSLRQRVILFGGSVVWHGAYNETWAWDGSQWTLVSNTGPSPRMYAAMAYDAVRDRMVLFGGISAWYDSTSPGDTWEWDGSSWTQVATTGPIGRSQSIMVYDPVRQRVVLFGGYTGSASNPSNLVYYDDTWEWDGVQWTKVQISGPSPSPRRGAAAFYDVNRGSVILVGGYGGPNFGFYHDTWEYHPDDAEGPLTSNVFASPNPVAVNTPVIFTAHVDDTTTGGSTIVAAHYSIDSDSTTPMAAQDGSFNEVSEEVIVATAPVFPQAGVHEICVEGTDFAGNIGAAECILLAVYDPTAGFVTGGGWINSPPGAYTPDTSLTGKANFGFVSKYQKGATTPTGVTEFQFKVANLNFHSDTYQWLVIAGARAQYKGTGTINGLGNYGFMLTAIDGQVSGGGGTDTFRMKIWDQNNNDTTVYDNQMGDSDTAAPTTMLGGGSIVIHAQ